MKEREGKREIVWRGGCERDCVEGMVVWRGGCERGGCERDCVRGGCERLCDVRGSMLKYEWERDAKR